MEKWKSKLKVPRFAVAAFTCLVALVAAYSTALLVAQQPRTSNAPITRLAPIAPIAPLAPTAIPFAPTRIQLAPTAKPDRTLVDTYCVSCHNQRTKTADLALDTLSLGDVSAHAEVWEEVARKLRGGLMPPAGVRRPPQADVDAFVR